MTPLSATQAVANWASAVKASHIPASVRLSAQTSLIDTIGVAIAGSATRVGRMAAAVGFSGRSNGNCIVLGTNHLVAATTAAFVNGAAAHALDFDDNCYAGVVHGSAVIAPAALALAQQTGASGSELLTAFVVGSESEYAFGAALDNVLYEQGWWTTGVLGPIGSCVAASRLLGLGPERMTSALGLALAGAGGSKSCFGTDAKPLLAGRASEAGIVCALLSAQGAVGPINAIESPSGFANLFNSGRFCQASLEKLGVAWFASYPGVDIKRIPVCLSSHAAVDAVMQIVTEHNIAFNKIESIKCDVPNIVRKNLVYDRPTSVQQSQFSMPFAIAVSLAYGTIKLEHLNERWLSDKSIDALMSRVQMDTGPRWLDTALNKAAPEGAHVSIRLTDGQHFEEFRATARGSVAYPLTKLEIETKFTQCAGPVIGDEASNSLLARLNSLDRSDPISKLF